MTLIYHLQNMILRIIRYFWDLLRLGAVFSCVFSVIMRMVEQDVVPDAVIRFGIRCLLRIRLFSVGVLGRTPCRFVVSQHMLSLHWTLLQMAGTLEQQLERKMAFVKELKCLPIAVQTAAANEQHYEV